MRTFRIAPLKGKYYGTEVQARGRNGQWVNVCTIWCNWVDPEPSDRELELWGDEEPWEGYDNHYESRFAYETALALVRSKPMNAPTEQHLDELPRQDTCLECREIPVAEQGQMCSNECYSTWLLRRMHMADGDPIRLATGDVLPLPLEKQPWYRGFLGGMQ